MKVMIVKCDKCNEDVHIRNYKEGSTTCKMCSPSYYKIKMIKEILSFKEKLTRGE